ncbi:MAG: DUF4965 domain-containing protein [Bacteroidales bacterium]|nr:DUF4965 domain-containing protein [Bacteroidales bacterium]
MQPHISISLILTAAIMASCCQNKATSELRAPSYPLITIDPYTSAWSPCDELYGGSVEHWTGFPYPFVGVLTVDGEDYRFLGREKTSEFRAVAAGAREHPWKGEYSTDGGRSWKEGEGGFGPSGRRPTTATFLNVKDVRAKRHVPAASIPDGSDMYMLCSSFGDAAFSVNGKTVANNTGRQEIEFHPVPAEALKAGADGDVILEARAKSDKDNAFVDMGLYERLEYRELYTRTAVQTSAQVLPMNTRYNFDCGPVELELSFTAPLFLDNLDLVSRPVNYISYSVKSKDGAGHDVKLLFSAGREWALDYAMDESSTADTYENNGITYVRTGCTNQNPLWKAGDNVRIDWGWFYLAADSKGTSASATGDGDISLTRELGVVNKAEGMIMAGYDDLYSIQYFGENLRPYWNADGNKTIESQFEAAAADYKSLVKRSAKFDAGLMADAERAGGRKYAELCALAYRQAITAHKLVVSPAGELLWLSKENNSNGSIGTVDVTYPSAPLFLLYNNELAKGLLNFIFEYSESGRWTKPFPTHDIGKYPLANGMRYGADMPVEEAGNMLILTAAVCINDNDASYAAKHWDTLTGWTDYLLQFGLDPENQLCTDDFAGRSAHNVNLSVKAILGIASYGRLAEMLGKRDVADEYTSKAREMAAEWERMANDGDHYRLAFDRPGSWSQKYNLVWDKLLGFNIFSPSVMQKEIPYYISIQNRYGLPLDNRSEYTKTDWILWTASMAESPEDFEALVTPVWNFYNETVDRVPMGDWVWSDKPEHVQFKARSVVGGLFIKLLEAQKFIPQR